MTATAPAGYERIQLRGIDGLAWAPIAQSLKALLADGTLHEYASRRSDHRVLEGRGPVYAISIDDTPFVVRHVRHGGVFAPVTGDIFLGSTRAPYELEVSIRLRDAGIATPQVLAYTLYTVAPGFRRADVLTREVPDAVDLYTLLREEPARVDHTSVWQAVRALIGDMSQVGAVHPDLNVKNVLIEQPTGPQPVAYVLDVDRVRWRVPGHDVLRANWTRLLRSARKRRIPIRVRVPPLFGLE